MLSMDKVSKNMYSIEWQTVSNAVLRSKRTRRLMTPVSEARRRSFTTLRSGEDEIQTEMVHANYICPNEAVVVCRPLFLRP